MTRSPRPSRPSAPALGDTIPRAPRTAIRRPLLPRALRLTLALGFAAASLATGAALLRAQAWPIAFATPAGGAFNVWAGQRIIVRFNQPMDRASVEAGLALRPAVAGTFAWPSLGGPTAGPQVEFIPNEPYAPGGTYEVTLASSIRDVQGRPVLTSPLKWTFTVASSPQLPSFSQRLPAQLLTPSGGRGMAFQPGYPRGTYQFRLYALDAPGFIQRYAALVPNTRNTIPTAGLRTAMVWTHAVDAVDGPVTVPMPPGTRPGLYVLEASHANTGSAQTLLMYTDYALVAKTGLRGVALWASRVPSGAPGSAARMALYDRAGNRLAEAGGDADGAARFGDMAGAAFAAAEVAGQTTLVGLDGYWYVEGYWSPASYLSARSAPRPPRFAGHIHTDRPIYRPGHTVHYKATLRQLAGDKPAVLAASTPVSVTIRDAGNNVIRQESPRTDGFGAVFGDLVLGDEVGLGNWKIEVAAGGQTMAGSFKVEEYVKPDYEVKVVPDKPFYVRGESTRLEVKASYYFGQAVAGGDVVLRVYRNNTVNRDNPLVERRGRLGPEGTFGADVTLTPQTEAGETFTVEAEVTDPSRRPVYATANVPVHPAAFALSLRNRRYGVELGQPVVLDVSTMGHDGKPAAGRAVEIETQVYDGGTGWYRTVRRETFTTGSGGTVEAALRDLGTGSYRILATARDDGGRAVSASSYAWLYSNRYPWYWRGGLEVQADQDSYADGETARLLVKSPVTGTALVTLERDEVYEEIVIPVAGATAVEVPIKPEYAPNIHAKVVIWQPLDDRAATRLNGAEGRLLIATTNLVVPAVREQLRVDVVPGAPVYKPGDQATLTLRVRDARGDPVSAQVALAVVDKAVLALAADPSGDLFAAFWKARANAVGTHDGVRPSHWYANRENDRSNRSTYWNGAPTTPHPPPRPTGAPGGPTSTPAAAPTGPPPSPAPTGTAGPSPTPGGPGGPAAPPDAPAAVPRREFRDTAYWAPAIETGPDGDATVTFVVPDNLTTWSALARAITVDTKAGQGTGEVVVTQPVIAEPALPRFAVQGDEFVLDVLGRNYAGGTQSGTCTLDTPGLVQLDKGERKLELPLNETRVARWSVVASKVGVNTVSARLVTPAGSDAIELPLGVQAFGIPERFARSGSTSDVAVEPFTLPFKAVPDDARIEIRLAPRIVSGIFDGAADLVGFPYGCVEQTMSKMLPNAVVARLAREPGAVPPEKLKELPEYMDAGLQKLYGFQNGDGSWGWWPGSGGRNLYLTAYVLHGLTLSQQGGYDVSAGALDRGFNWLAAAVRNEPDVNMRAYALYIMAEAGRAAPVADAADQLYGQRASLDAFGLGALAVALDTLGRREAAIQVLDDLVAKAVQAPETAHWTMGAPPGGEWHAIYWQSIASDEKSTAMALVALARLRPGDALALKAAAWLLTRRTGAGWSTTHGTAFAIVALTDHVIASGELRGTYDWSVRLDADIVAEGRVGEGTRADGIPPIVLLGRDLAPGEHAVTISVEGRGRLYYTISGQMTLFSPGFQPAEAAGIGVSLKREYMPVTGRGGPDGWRAGDLVNVRLTLTTQREAHYMLIEDKLPAGLEAINDRLATESTRVPGQSPWRWWGYERKEVRDDKVTFFATRLNAGTYTYEYAARAVTPGTFSARPAEAYAMYRPDVWGRSASARFTIDAGAVAARPALPGDLDRDCRLSGFDAALVADVWGRDAGGAGGIDRDRDINGDGRIDVADVATSVGRDGLACGDAAPLPPGKAGDVALGLKAPAGIVQGQTFEVEIAAESTAPADPGAPIAALDIGGWEATLALPDGAFEVVGLAGGDALPDMRVLGPVAGGGTVRVGGFVPRSATAAGEVVLGTLTLRALRAGDARLGVMRAQVVTGAGGEYAVTAGGAVVSPEPWRPVGRVFVPVVER